MNDNQDKDRMTHASLFSGIGGAEIAAEWMGWTNLFHCEINPFGRKVLEYWYPNSTSYEDITKTDFSEWRGRVDVLTAGFPCQPFSVAGQRKGADDDRYLWPQVVRAVREIRPAWVVGENVAGILTMVQPGEEVEMGSGSALFDENHLYRTEQQYVIETVCQDLEREGYSVQPFVIPACAVGAPHRRDRVWIIAHRADAGAETMQCERENGVHAAGLLPTPTSIDSGSGRINKSPSLGAKERPTIALAAKMGLLPTPMSTDIHHAERVEELKQRGKSGLRCREKGKSGANGLTDFLDFHGMLLTPSASEGMRANFTMESLKRHNKKNAENSNLSEQIAHKVNGGTSQLNPLFVTEMMGFPSDWLVSPFQNGGQKPSKP